MLYKRLEFSKIYIRKVMIKNYLKNLTFKKLLFQVLQYLEVIFKNIK